MVTVELQERRTLLSPDEIVPASLGELYRYRLAVQEQLIRVDTAIGAMRAERDRIERTNGSTCWPD